LTLALQRRMLAAHPMILQTSITHTHPASPSRWVPFARTETFGRMAFLVTEQNRPPVQGCFPITD
jgi:hypothetical protein